MGDVWPAVEPGRAPRDYGSALLTPTAPCTVRSFQTFQIIYTVGRFGLDDTGAIRVSCRWVTDSGMLQTDDPRGINHVTARSSNGAPLTLYVEPYGFRPWSLALRVTVDGGFMRPGDTIEITFGDRSGGSPGYRIQTIAEDAFEFKVSVDACATGQFNPLDDELHFPVIAGPLEKWELVAPGRRRPGDRFDLGLRGEDAWGNPAPMPAGTYRITCDGPADGVPGTVTLDGRAAARRLSGLNIPDEGNFRFTLRGPDGDDLATSNPLVVDAGARAGFWGDLHGQSGETVGIGTIGEYMDFARNSAFLDVCGHQGNDFQITNEFWAEINATTAKLDQAGAFVVFPGYEWSGNTPVGGDHNVFFRHEGGQIRRSSHAMLADRSDLGTDANTLDALFDALRAEDCVLWSHIGGRPADVAYAHDPVLKTAVEVHSNWGTFEWVLTDSLALGHRVGVVASSDGHKGRPGAGSPGATEFGAYGGLTCFLAPELSRDAIFECMRRRHHYGTSGSRIDLDVTARFAAPVEVFRRDPEHVATEPDITDTAMMGDIVRHGGAGLDLHLRVAAPAPIERIDVMRGTEIAATLRPYGVSDLGNRVRILWQGAEYRGRGRNTYWRGDIRVSNASITQMTPINRWNLERELTLSDGRHIAFDAVTSGNFGGVEVILDSDQARLSIDSNLTAGEVALGDLGLEDLVLDAGGLDRQIRVRRLPDPVTPSEMDVTCPIPDPGSGDAIWVRVTTGDGHTAWSSPTYLV
ncbi:MAG: DUF3604 domain-containing protein [Pseudomonadota bacterium]